MSHRAIVICEPEPYWTPELQRQFLGKQIAVRGCRKWSELIELSRKFERAVRIVDFSSIAAECLSGMACEAALSKHQPLILLVDAEAAELEWTLREAGADGVLPDHVTADELTRICRRCWA